jgi:predicted GNAT family N-acyltransferase
MHFHIVVTQYTGGGEKEILNLVRRVFDEFCSADCDSFGLKVFYDFIEEYNFIERNKTNSITFIAKSGNKTAGMIEMRDFNHICLLFVDKKFQGMGIAGRLFKSALEATAVKNSRLIDVNASLFSVPVYEKLGFRKTADLVEFNGIKYVPMEFKIK